MEEDKSERNDKEEGGSSQEGTRMAQGCCA